MKSFSAKTDRILIGAWYPVDLRYLDQRHIDEIKESGIDFLFAAWGDAGQRQQIFEYCDKAGLLVMTGDARISSGEPDPALFRAAIAEYADHPSFMGNMIRDEPGAAAFPDLAAKVRAYKEACPDGRAGINLFPIYAPLSALQTDSYEEHIDRYAKTVDTAYISVDIYPFSQGEDGVKRTSGIYFRNLDIVATACRTYDRDFCGFIQTMGFNYVMRPPTEAEMRWQAYAYLAFGAKEVYHFCYATPPSGGEHFEYAMIDLNGEKTALWYAAKAVNDELHALSDTYMQYRNLGAFLHQAGEPSDGVQFDNQFSIEGYEALTAVESDETALIGCFESADGRAALVLLNASEIRREASANVVLTVNAKQITVYRRGIPNCIRSDNGVFPVTLDCCEGVFITIDR